MTIEGGDFRLTPVDEHTPFFNLELLYTVKPRGGEARQEFKIVGYGMALENAIKHIVQYRLSHKHDTIELMEFLKEFKKEVKSIKSDFEL